MSGEIVNLRQHRKRKARTEREQQAAENRAVFGRTKAEREREAADRERSRRTLEGHRRRDGDEPGRE